MPETLCPIDLDALHEALYPALQLTGAELQASYRHSARAKRDGSLREICEPVGVLRVAQEYLASHIWSWLRVAREAHGYVEGRSIVTHAAVHAPCHTLLTMDIHDFFGSFRDDAVIDVLVAAGFPRKVAVDIARLCVMPPPGRGLPQGAPTSPGLANACFGVVDAFLTALAQVYGARYSRYVDDLAFSWIDDSVHVPSVYTGCLIVLSGNGFVSAPNKFRVSRHPQPQRITGLVINPHPGRPAVRAPRERWRATRAAIFNAEQKAAGGLKLGLRLLDELQGLVSFLQMTDAERAAPLAARVAKLREGDLR